MEEKDFDKLREDEKFQKALDKYKKAEELSSEKAKVLAEELIQSFALKDSSQTIEEARFGLVVAKMAASKILATLSSFSYEEKTFMESLDNARRCVQEELIPMLINAQPCGECEECKNGHPEKCIRPNIRNAYCESRFLPLLCNSLIEYDAFSEILYTNIEEEE